MSARDEELSRRLAATLDNSIDGLDADTCARLAALRQAALARGHTRRVMGGLALAAGLAALLVAPWLLHQTTSPINGVGYGAEDMAYLSVDPQLLDDMDMLQGMDELQDSEDLAPALNAPRGDS